jgi:hypothetical protein
MRHPGLGRKNPISRRLRLTVRRRFSRMQNQRGHIPMVDFGLAVVPGAATPRGGIHDAGPPTRSP